MVTMTELTTVGVIGCGNLGGALIRGLVKKQVVPAAQIRIFDIDLEKSRRLVEECGVTTVAGVPEIAEQSALIVLAVKPQQISATIRALRPALPAKSIVVSVAAGVPLAPMRSVVGPLTPLVRAMPNLPCLSGCGMTVLYSEEQEALALADQLFRSLGETAVAHHEGELDVVSALSGGGPAFIALVVEALADGGVKMGLGRELAQRLVVQTLLGTATMLRDQALHPATVREMVSSPGGVTIRGLHELERGAVRSALINCIEVATLRAQEMARLNQN